MNVIATKIGHHRPADELVPAHAEALEARADVKSRVAAPPLALREPQGERAKYSPIFMPGGATDQGHVRFRPQGGIWGGVARHRPEVAFRFR